MLDKIDMLDKLDKLDKLDMLDTTPNATSNAKHQTLPVPLILRYCF